MSKKISQLAEVTTVLSTDLLAVVNGGETKKVTKQNLLKDNPQDTDFIDSEIPAGDIDGINTVFTTAFDFTAGSTHLYWNGLRLTPEEDYTETGDNEITVTAAPEEGDNLLIDYRK